MKNYSTIELTKEIYSRGLEVIDPKEIATQGGFTIDDAIDAISDLNRNTLQMDNELSHEVLMEILNDTLASAEVQKFIYNKLKDNIQAYLEA
jgi:hypothetical protein